MKDLRRAFDAARYASEQRGYLYGQLGRPDGTVAIADRPGWVYVRLSSQGEQSLSMARNANRVPQRPNLPVRLRRESGVLVIVDLDTSTVWEASTGGPDNPYGVTHHTHRIGTGLEYEVEGLRLEPGRVYPAGGLEVTINPFRYYQAGVWQTYAGTTISLGIYRPATTGKHYWALVCVDPSTNTEVVLTGDEENYATTLTAAMLDEIDSLDYIPLAGVQLRNDDTSIESYSKYYDARGWINLGIGYTDENAQDAIGGIATATATITPTYNDVTPSLTWDVNNDSITFAKLQNIATDKLVGRDTASSGDPEEISVGGGLEFTGGPGIQRSALTGDVTASAGSGATTIANDAVNNAKLANMAEATVKGRAAGAGAGDPQDLVVAQLIGIIATGDGAGSALDADLFDGLDSPHYLDRANHTGTQLASTISDFAEAVDDRVGALIVDGTTIDFTYTDGSNTLSAEVKNDAVTNAILANMAEATIKGRAAGAGTGDPTDLTAAQVITVLETVTPYVPRDYVRTVTTQSFTIADNEVMIVPDLEIGDTHTVTLGTNARLIMIDA